jgi:RHS repeat-associated protein
MKFVNDFKLTGVTTATVWGTGSNGELLIDLFRASDSITLYTWQPTLNYPNPDLLTVPRSILVVSPDGKSATEFHYLNPQYAKYWSGSPSPSGQGYPSQSLLMPAQPIQPPSQNDLKCVHYLPVTWMNRFGDLITFNHTPNGGTGNGVDFDANWTRNGGAILASAQIRLQAMPAASAPALNTGGGVNQVSGGGRIKVSYVGATHTTYSLDAFTPNGTTVDMTGISWGRPSDKPWDAYRRNLQPYKLTVDTTGESVQFEYVSGTTINNMTLPVTLKSLTFPNRKQTFTWMPYKYRRPEGTWSYTDNPYWIDVYTSGGVTQVVDQDLSGGGQTRTTSYERVTPIPDESHPSGPYWTSTTFWVAVTRPDGQVTTTRFAEPLNHTPIDSTNIPNYYQSIAHLKHLPVDIREYLPGQDWRSDLVAAPQSSVSYRVIQFGAPLVGLPGTASGEASRFAVGSALVNPYWNFVTANAPNGGLIPYSTRQETWQKDTIGATLHRVETQSDWDNQGGGWQTQTLTAEHLGVQGSSVTRTTTRHYESDLTRWFMGRVVYEKKPDQPSVDFAYNPDNTVDTATVNKGGSPEVKASYTYNGALPDPVTVTLTSPTLDLSGAVGAAYTFDLYGLVNTITPKTPVGSGGFFLGEDHDAFGRPVQQTGANGETMTIQWDPMNRLSLLRPNPEVGAVITFPDLLTTVETRGLQQTTYHYNGFGELVKMDRQGGSRTFNYDYAGRKTFESVWADPLTGTTISYDYQGRVALVTDPNNEQTQTIYEGPKKRIIHGGIETQFFSDPLGQLTQVTDALGQISTYGYDQAGRVTMVQQSGATGTQVRTWHYNPMGWLDQLTQPESGVTSYSDFTVHGKAKTTTYNGGRIVSTGYDTLGRVSGITSADGTVTQSFVYGENEAGHGSAKNKLVRATANGISRVMDYNGTRGRLSQLTRNVDTVIAVLGFGYDSTYGLLTSRTYPDGKVQKLDYDWVKGQPASSGFGVNPSLTDLVSGLSYEPAGWGVNQISWANAATSSFTYDRDQARLKTMTHNIPGQLDNKKWTYTYDPAGRMTNDNEDWYAYDALGRLTSAYVRDPWDASGGLGPSGLLQQFAYDTFGNRTNLHSNVVLNWAAGTAPPQIQSAILDWTTKAQSYDMTTAEVTTMGLTNRLPDTIGGVSTGAISGEGPANGHDAQGNLQRIYGKLGDSRTLLTMTYDALARVTSLGDSANANTQTYGYDDEGLRIKIVDAATGKTTYNIYNEARQLIAQYEKVGTGSVMWKKDIVYIGTKEVAEVSTTGTSITLVDHLGSPRYLWAGSGGVTPQKFLPFGEQLGDPTSVSKFAKGFTNHEQTDQSGLIYMQARFYLPTYGRFLSPDPARDQHFEETQTWNIYSYVQNCPTMRVDPSGMQDPSLDPLSELQIKSQNNQRMAAATAQARQANTGPAQKEFKFSESSYIQPPGTAASFFPIFGSAKQASSDFDHGKYVMGTLNTTLAVSDVFLIKSIATGLGKGAIKLGTHSWSATSKWLTNTGWRAFKGQNAHHWLIPQGGWAKGRLSALKNQPWNLMMMSASEHQWLHNVAGPVERVVSGSPTWFKNLVFNITGKEVQQERKDHD